MAQIPQDPYREQGGGPSAWSPEAANPYAQPVPPPIPATPPPVPAAAPPVPSAPQPWTPQGALPGQVRVEPQAWQPSTQPPQAFAPGGAPAPQPMNRRTKRRIIGWSIALLLLIVLIVGVFVTANAMNEARDPAAQVSEYLEHLERGEAEQASRMVDPGVSGAGAALLSDEVLSSATERISVRSVETVSRTSDGAEVLAKLSLGGEDFEHTFRVNHGPKEFLVLDTWEFDEPLLANLTVRAELAADAAGIPTAMRIGESPLEVGSRGEGDTYFEAEAVVYPGVYPVVAEAGSYFQAVKGQQAALPGSADDEGESIGRLEPNEQLEATLLAQAQQYADGCVSIEGNDVVSSNMDPACPYLTQSRRLNELRVLQYPRTVRELDLAVLGDLTIEGYDFEVVGNWEHAEAQRQTYQLEGNVEWRDGEPIITGARFDAY